MKRHITFLTLALFVLFMLAGCSAISLPTSPSLPGLPFLPSGSAPPTSTPSANTFPNSVVHSTGSALPSIENNLENIYSQVSPSVVTIRVVTKAQVTIPTIPEIPNFPFFTPPFPQGPQTQIQQALGSGFVWDKEGHIITNNHVIAGADQISIDFSNNTTEPGKVVGADPNSDLAVVKVDVAPNMLQPVQMADSTQVKVGQYVIAIGNPFGEQNTMTTGVVSALGRSLPVNDGSVQGATYTIPDVIQTDAPINPGNSGGVLVNDVGHVIGVTSAIESPVRASSGIGFAIPSAIVKKVVPALIKTGHYDHPWLGITGATLNPSLAKAMGLEDNQRGALVIDVTQGSPAEKAGLRGSTHQMTINGETARVGGDVIVAIDAVPVKSFDDLVAYMARSTDVGQTITLTVLRDNKQEAVHITLAARPAAETQGNGPQAQSAQAWLGVQGLTLTSQIAQAMNLSADQKGVLIERVEAGSPAEDAGLQGSFKSQTIEGRLVQIGGDVIVALDGQDVTQVSDLQSMIAQDNAGDVVQLTILRDGHEMTLQATLGGQP